MNLIRYNLSDQIKWGSPSVQERFLKRMRKKNKCCKRFLPSLSAPAEYGFLPKMDNYGKDEDGAPQPPPPYSAQYSATSAPPPPPRAKTNQVYPQVTPTAVDQPVGQNQIVDDAQPTVNDEDADDFMCILCCVGELLRCSRAVSRAAKKFSLITLITVFCALILRQYRSPS